MWQKNVWPDVLQEKSRLKKWRIYAVFEKQGNYELVFSDPGCIYR